MESKNVFRYMNRLVLSKIKDIPNIKDKVYESANKLLENTRNDEQRLTIARNLAISQQDWINAAIYDITIAILKERRGVK